MTANSDDAHALDLDADASRRESESALSPHGRSQHIDTRPRTPTLAGPFTADTRDLDDSQLYLNREATWLSFNCRVLNESKDPRTPLLERMKFLAIVGNNVDEFFMKRIGGLKQQIGANVSRLTVDGRTPIEQIDMCREMVNEIESDIESLVPRILDELKTHNIFVSKFDDLDGADKQWLRDYYVRNVFPLLTPQAVDPAHPFPFISNLSLNLLVTLKHPNDDELLAARVKVPAGDGIDRFVGVRDTHNFIHLADVIAANLDLLFPGMEIISCKRFHLTRNAHTDQDSDSSGAEDLLEVIESELRNRHFAPIVRLVVERSMDEESRLRLANELALESTDVYTTDGVLPVSDWMEIANINIPELHDPVHRPVDHARIDETRNIFDQIRETGPFLLHHPYESFSTTVERFLREASCDPKVRAIKMTLYRTSNESKIIEYLIDAAVNGKQVAVVVELKARFDEAANIRWAGRLEKAGIHVTYGIVGLKTHTKTTLVIRNDNDGLKRYAHIGTGNYHSGTARLYSDLAILTSDAQTGRDLTELFNYLTTGFSVARHYRKLLAAPTALKKALIKKIQREVELVKHGERGLIRFKLNGLEDPDISRELYAASQQGVKVELLIRDTCRLRPGIPGLSENITVVSIVGRFLEHSRVYYFRNGGNDEYYIGSADAMTRNLEHRVEVVTPVESEQNRHELAIMLDLQFADRRCGWEMASDGSYVQRRSVDANITGSQQQLIELAEARARTAERQRRRTVWPTPDRLS